ncbi:sohB, partial [Symbiodinium pilosum]
VPWQLSWLVWAPVAPAFAEDPQSPEDVLAQLIKKATGQDGDASESTPSLLLLGFGALLLYGVFAVFKFLLAAVGGLFVVRELDQQFGKDQFGFDLISLFVEKALRRFSGEPLDLLEERRLKVVRLNDEVVSFQAALVEQTSGLSAGAALRDKTRRRRFAETWQHVPDDVAISEAERQKIEEAVEKYMASERERQEDFRESRGLYLKSLFESSFFGSMTTRFQISSSLEKQIKLQEELISEIKRAVPDSKFENLKKILSDNVDLTWLIDQAQESQKDHEKPNTVYVLSFDGDPTAAGVNLLAQEVTAILEAQKPPAEVVLKLKSPGGTVTGYGLAAAQLLRLRERGVRLVACVDELAASGGYMMACCADVILCSPFAAVGSIGVIAGVPNAVERLDREGLKVIQTTAGKWKRTIDPFQQPTEEAMEKAKEDVNRIYQQFSRFVKGNRPNINIEEVATGEVWFGADALEKGLVDELKTSSEYLLQHMKLGHEVLSLTYNTQSRGLGGFVGSLATASEFAEALGTDMSEVSQFAKLLSPIAESSSWPSSLPQPRVQAQGPLGSLGDSGF